MKILTLIQNNLNLQSVEKYYHYKKLNTSINHYTHSKYTKKKKKKTQHMCEAFTFWYIG